VALTPLPIDPFVPEIVARVREARAAVVVAAPGAGKTTRVPPALVDDGPLILLQPRRIAARSIARRIAAEQGWTAGDEVGWHVRFEPQFRDSTRLVVATEGILTARLQQDPLLTAFRTVIIDEFHERTIHADLGLALARQAWRARADLRIVIMSATMDPAPAAAYLDDCPVIDVPGQLYPMDIRYAPGSSVAIAVSEMLAETAGQILCFLPGAGEIARALPEVERISSVEVVPLHGSLPSADQDRAIAPVPQRRVILATNIAETSLTVPGVTGVVDSGLQKVARYDAGRAIDRLDTERISLDAADQRAGRAGRLGPGVVRRLWHSADRLRTTRQPDIQRIDLSGPVLDVLAWGASPETLEWFEPPPAHAIEAALDLLRALGAIERGSHASPTPIGRAMQKLPISPRLARILIASGGAPNVALACALMTERRSLSAGSARSTTSDLLAAIDRPDDVPPQARRVAEGLLQAFGTAPVTVNDENFRRAFLAGYPDRVARRRQPGSPRVLMASGHGAVVSEESGVRDGDFLLALDVTAATTREGAAEARIRLASRVERDWLAPGERRLEHEFDRESGTVKAFEREYYGAIVLAERPLAPDAAESARLLARAFIERGLGDEDEQLVRRLMFAGIGLDVEGLVLQASHGRRSLKDVNLSSALPWDVQQRLDSLAPTRLAVPSGRTVPLRYELDGAVAAEVKLQEMFGLAETPRLGPNRTPVLMMLLAPNGLPVQMTRDLRSFWERTYPEIRKDLRGRYPKHPWPEDPWTATPTARTNRRKA
jgi:ATP-dependent helicase HrpB